MDHGSCQHPHPQHLCSIQTSTVVVNSGGQFKACCKRLELKVTQVNSFLECLLSKAGLLLVLFVCLFVNSTFSHNSKLKTTLDLSFLLLLLLSFFSVLFCCPATIKTVQ